MLRARLALHLDDARELAADGTIVGCPTALETWRECQQDWRNTTAQTLGAHFEPEALEEFLYATQQPPATPERWRQALAEDLRRVANAIELLAGLEATLDGHGPQGRATVTRLSPLPGRRP
jgi:HEAT repeat protein